MTEAGGNRRAFSESDIAEIGRIVSDGLMKGLNAHQCTFSADEIAALRSFSQDIKDPATRRALISASEWANAGNQFVRAWVMRLLFWGALGGGIIIAYFKMKD